MFGAGEERAVPHSDSRDRHEGSRPCSRGSQRSRSGHRERKRRHQGPTARIAHDCFSRGHPFRTTDACCHSRKGRFTWRWSREYPLSPSLCLALSRAGRRRASRCGPAQATVVFHPPLDPRSYPDRDSLMKAVSDTIASALPAERREPAPNPQSVPNIS